MMICVYVIYDDMCICNVWWSVCMLYMMICVYVMYDDLCICYIWWNVYMLYMMICVYVIYDDMCICYIWWSVYMLYMMICVYVMYDDCIIQINQLLSRQVVSHYDNYPRRQSVIISPPLHLWWSIITAQVVTVTAV